MNFAYYAPGSSEPLTYAQVTALRAPRTETEWQRYEALEGTQGRAHETDRPDTDRSN